MRIIGITGPAGAGKSTVAAYLEQRYGATRYSLAAPLKAIVQQAFALSHAQINGTQAEKEAIDPRYGVSPRWLLQRIGTEGVRSVMGADVWALMLRARIASERPEIAVVDDVRFENEASVLRELAGPRWRLWKLRPPIGAPALGQTHASESGWDRIPHTEQFLPCEYGVKTLYMWVDSVMVKP
jgi:hypothetical protein